MSTPSISIEALAKLILGFDETSQVTKEQIEKAFKERAKKFHPDMGGTIESFRAISLSKELLLDSNSAQNQTYSTENTKTAYKGYSKQYLELRIKERAEVCLEELHDNLSFLVTTFIFENETSRWEFKKIKVFRYYKELEVSFINKTNRHITEIELSKVWHCLNWYYATNKWRTLKHHKKLTVFSENENVTFSYEKSSFFKWLIS